MKWLVAALCVLTTSLSALADDYTTFLTAARGFTEVTSTDDITGNANDYYILTPAETNSLIVGVGTYEGKPDWAGENTKALRYLSAATDPVLNLSNFFTIEKSGQYIGFRNVVYSTDLFQTHDNAGYMYVLTYTEPTLSDWCYLTPTFQSGYWLFESGKYPMSSENWACGYLGPWNKTVAAGEPIALNRRNTSDDLAGHYRLWRIAKGDLILMWSQLWQAASGSNKIDATWMVTNPSFETGDERGWTLTGKDPNGNDEFKTRDYGMSNKDGNYLMNAYQWWAPLLEVSQTVSNLPSGEYELSGVVATWEGRTVYLKGNSETVTKDGQGDGTGIPASLNVTVDMSGKLTISAGSTAQWWNSGHEGEDRTFFKLDNVQLKCKSVYLNGIAQPLPNDNATTLTPNQWYYYDFPAHSEYWFLGGIDGMVYSADGLTHPSSATTSAVGRKMTMQRRRYYFKTTNDDVTLQITSERTISEGTFTAVALNVDGLPQDILGIDMNADGPGADGTKKISKYLASKGYDFIGCSEDFNYNGSLMESLNDNYSCGTIRKTLSVSGVFGGFPFDTDGLNLIWKNTLAADNESWTRWNDRTDTYGNQYVKKGYRHYDLTLPGNVVIDVFILHMDAGDTNATGSRHSQWQQLAGAINSTDATRPKLIIGDTNSRWTREDIATNFMDLLNSNLVASDVWVEFYRNGVYPTTDMDDLTDQGDPTNYTNYEIVDKIIYINPTAANTLQLIPQSFRIEQDYTYGNVDGTDDTTPLGDHKPVVVEFKYVKSGDVVPLALDLANNGINNSTTVANAATATADVTLSGRTLYKDGEWNTLCLPFNLTLDGSILEGATVKELTAATMTGTHVDLTFGDVTTLTAGTPYIIKWASGTDITDPTFAGVTLSSTAAQTISKDGGHIQFVGYYDAFNITRDDTDIYYLTSGSQLKCTDIPRTLKACRAYFRFTEKEGNAKAYSFRLDFGDSVVTSVSGLPQTTRTASWHSLDGRRLSGEPSQRGIYVRNGQKVVLK